MASGTDILVNSLLKAAGFDPEDFKKMLGGTMQTIVQAKAQMDRIEANQHAIMIHLGIEMRSQPNGAANVNAGRIEQRQDG